MIRAFNPDNLPGRLAVVVRMGAGKLRAHLPALIEAVEQAQLVSGVDILDASCDDREIVRVWQAARTPARPHRGRRAGAAGEHH